MSTFKELGLTIVHPFWNDVHMRLPLQIEAWNTYPGWVWDCVKIILVDDCSEPPLSLPVIDPKIDLSLYRITDNLLWNLPGAYNLGFSQVETEWMLGMDSDHRLTKEIMIKLLTEVEVKEDRIYRFPSHDRRPPTSFHHFF